MTSSNIIYRGKVTVKVKGKPPVKMNNNGTKSFFNSLYNILSLTTLASDPVRFKSTLPCEMSIVLFDNDEPFNCENDDYSNIVSKSILTTPMQISSRKLDPTSNAKNINLSTSVTYECLLTHGYINTTKYDSTKTGFIVLLDGQSKQKVLAYTDFNLGEIADVASTANSQATISWQLSFGNGGVN